MRYRTYSRGQFEYKLRGIYYNNHIYLPELLEISDKLRTYGEINEYVYELPTKSNAVKFVIYSSVDIDSGYTRDVGSDAVRVIQRWDYTRFNKITGMNEIFSSYRKIAKHLRIETLFDNLEQTILSNYDTTTGLKAKDFIPEIDFFG